MVTVDELINKLNTLKEDNLLDGNSEVFLINNDRSSEQRIPISLVYTSKFFNKFNNESSVILQ